MNLVANTCMGGFLYQLNNEPFGNPFIWAMTQSKSMIQCINNFSKINWSNVKLFRDNTNPIKTRNTYNMEIDGLVTIHYTHYLKDKKCNSPTINGVDVHFNNIEYYIVEKYFSRCKRMCSAAVKPCFCILCTDMMRYDYTLENTRQLLEETANAPYTKILITNHASLVEYENTNTHIFVDDHPLNQGRYDTKWFATQYYKDIMNIVNHVK